MKKAVVVFILVLMFLGSFVYTLNSHGERSHIRVVGLNSDIESNLFDVNAGVWVSDGETPYVPTNGFNYNTVWFE